LCFFFITDSYSSDDIIFEWNATEVSVGTKQMAQFDYKGSELSSDMEAFSIGSTNQWIDDI